MSMPQEPVWYSAAQLEETVRAFMQREREAHQSELAQLKAQVETLAKSVSGNVPTSVVEHGAGVGLAVHPTWSKYEQELQHAAREAAAVAAVAEKAMPVVLPYIEGLS